MPFITQERRKLIEKRGLAGLYKEGIVVQPGDRCYMFYKEMVEKWKANPRWTTAHEIYKHIVHTCPDNEDDQVAEDLAWQVFFQLYVMPYEQNKRHENGDI